MCPCSCSVCILHSSQQASRYPASACCWQLASTEGTRVTMRMPTCAGPDWSRRRGRDRARYGRTPRFGPRRSSATTRRGGAAPGPRALPGHHARQRGEGAHMLTNHAQHGRMLLSGPYLLKVCISLHCRPMQFAAHAAAGSRSPDRAAPVATPRSCLHWSAGRARAAPTRPTPACGR